MKHTARRALALTATLTGLLLSGAAGATAASATPPTREPIAETDPGVVDCGNFQDNFVDFFTGTATTFYDANGEPVKLFLNAEHTSNDVNSVTGFTVHEHGHLTVTLAWMAGLLVVFVPLALRGYARRA